ncbi:MAG: AAA family ATPase [Apibacter sp.]|nr:AAA family ATPase [Apibacter sp.]
MIISLLGYMGCGKSTIGKSLAKVLLLPFTDLDNYISFHEKKTVQQIFSEHGEIHFRKKEKYYLNELINQNNVILSLGGGTPIYYDNMKLITDKSISFYLKMSPSELYERLITEKKHRPLISHLNDESLKEFIAKHLFERSAFYEQAEHIIRVSEKKPDEICKEIIHILQSER